VSTGIDELTPWEGRSAEEWRRLWGVPELHLFASCSSTNDIARARAAAGAPARAVVLADEQTAGRGRLGRRWLAPPRAALLLTMVLRPAPPAAGNAAPGAVPIRVGLAAARALRSTTGLDIALKWPNDLVLAGAGKLGGILCEAAWPAASPAFVVAGIGINVHQRPEDWPPDLRAGATSLAQVGDAGISRPDLAGAIIRELSGIADSEAGPLDFEELAALERLDALRGRPVLVDGRPRGTAAGIAADGSLRVRRSDGRLDLVYSGTVRVPEEREDLRK